MTRIILFFPKLESQSEHLLPASVLMVAAPLVEKGYEIKVIDQRVEKNWRDVLTKELKKEPLVFGVSALTGKQILNGLEASKLVKENGAVPIVWGGVHASLLPKQTLKNDLIDFVVFGEGEKTFVELVEELNGGGDSFEKIDGLGYKKDGQIILNRERAFENINDLPGIPYQLVNIENYISERSMATGKKARNIAFYSSRGCPHRCGFCYNQKFNKGRWRGKSSQRVVAEMEDLIKNYNISSFDIEDDEFFVDLERAKEICELILQKKWDIEIFATCRFNYLVRMDDEYLQLIKKAGFKTLAFGVETGSEKILNLIHKDITIKQVLDGIKRLKKAGIGSKHYFMVGFPQETEKDMLATTDLIGKMKEIDAQIKIPFWRTFTPYPGTVLYELSKQGGFNPPQNLEDWASYNFETIKMPWINKRKGKIIKNVIFLMKYLEIGKTRGRGVFFLFGKQYSKIAGWRWKNHKFLFVPEKYLILLLQKIKKFITNQESKAFGFEFF